MSSSPGTSALAAGTDIRPEPGGKRLLFVDNQDIRKEPGGKRLLFVDGDSLRAEPGGPRLLYFDGSDVRPEPGGIRIAAWDGPTLRRWPGGKILLVVDGRDIRPEAGGKRLLFIDGAELTREQVSAVLYQLKPEVFKLSAEEKKFAEDAIKEGQAYDAAQIAPERENGDYSPINGTGPWGEKAGGVSLKWTGNHYAMKFQKQGLVGAGLKVEDSGYKVIGGVGKGKFTTGIFRFKNDAWTGSWIAAPGTDPKSQQPDTWKTGEEADGDFASKVGKLTFKATEEKLDGEGEIREVTSDKGAKGYAFRFGNKAVGFTLIFALGPEAGVFHFKSDGGGMVGDYYAGGETKGYFNLTK